MSLLSDLKTLVSGLSIPVETGVFTDEAPAQYYETETGYHHYNVDVAQYYEMEE